MSMLSAEAVITMISGEFKPVNQLVRGNIIANKFFEPVKVLKVETFLNKLAVGIQLNNGTGIFYTCPNCKVYCSYLENNKTKAQFLTYAQANQKDANLKSSIKMFSTNNNVTITTYDDSDPNLTKTLYKIITADQGTSYYANGVIISSA